MNFLIPYNQNGSFRYYDEENVILAIDYWTKDTTIAEFLERYTNRRVEMTLYDLDIRRIKSLYDKFHNFTVKIPDAMYKRDPGIVNEIKEAGIPFLLSTIVTDIDEFTSLLNLGPTEIYVGYNLGFHMEALGKLTAAKEVGIRIFPNVSQSLAKDIPFEKTFWVRPNDIDAYNNIGVTSCEFKCEPHQLSVYYEAYSIDKNWFGDLREIIKGCNIPIDNRSLAPYFVNVRTHCGKKCLYGGVCDLCSKHVHFAKTLAERNVMWH